MFPVDFSALANEVFQRLDRVLQEADATLNDIVKLNLFIVGQDAQVEEFFHQACRV